MHQPGPPPCGQLVGGVSITCRARAPPPESLILQVWGWGLGIGRSPGPPVMPRLLVREALGEQGSRQSGACLRLSRLVGETPESAGRVGQNKGKVWLLHNTRQVEKLLGDG